MRPIFALLGAALLLAACAGDDRREPIASPVAVRFAADAADVIEAEVTDRQPVDRVELAGPDGRVVPAYQILRDTAAEAGVGLRPSIGVGVSGGSSSRVGVGVGIGFPIGGFERPAEPPPVRSLARLRVPDMAAYRAAWPRWTLRIRLGTPEAGFRFMEVPAPRPPEQ